MKIRGASQESQQEEDQHLHQTGQPIEEIHQGLFTRELAVSQHDTHKVRTQISIATD